MISCDATPFSRPVAVRWKCKGVLCGALMLRRCSILRATARTGQKKGWPLSPWAMISPLTEFFCVVKVSRTAVALCSRSIGVVWRLRWLVPRRSCVSSRRNGCASAELLQYSPGLMRKKTAMMVISIAALMCWSRLGWVAARSAMWRRIGNGIGFVRLGAGSCFAK